MIEIQIHPGNIRKKVKYFFLKKKQMIFLGILSLGLICFFFWSLIIAPTGFTSHLTRLRFSNALSDHTRFLTRINNLSRKSIELSSQLDEQRQLLEKFYTIYNIHLTSRGQGGMEEVMIPKSSQGFDRLEQVHRKLDQQVAVSKKLLEELTEYEQENKNIADITPTLCPIPGGDFVLTSPYGHRTNPFTRKRDFHQGLDFSAPIGTPVVATADGRVSFAGRYSLRKSAAWWRYGNIVVLKHDSSFITIYAHLSKVRVKKNQKVKRGQQVGEVGNSGWSTSPHLHYEVRSNLADEKRYSPVDPRIYILDHHWSNLDQILISARSRSTVDYEPIPSMFRR